uniref:Uncharacterized protein n=1 Tax=Kalanchoe fedtschenkoi TaxID=63787 RepID=A0A7N0UUI8_KALFE
MERQAALWQSRGLSRYAVDLHRKMVQSALSSESGAVQSSFSHVTPSSAVFQVIIGGAAGGASFSGGATAASAPPGGGGAPARQHLQPKRKKKKRKRVMMTWEIHFSTRLHL